MERNVRKQCRSRRELTWHFQWGGCTGIWRWGLIVCVLESALRCTWQPSLNILQVWNIYWRSVTNADVKACWNNVIFLCKKLLNFNYDFYKWTHNFGHSYFNVHVKLFELCFISTFDIVNCKDILFLNIFL